MGKLFHGILKVGVGKRNNFAQKAGKGKFTFLLPEPFAFKNGAKERTIEKSPKLMLLVPTTSRIWGMKK